MSLAEELVVEQITIVGTIRTNKVEILKEMLPSSTRPEKSSLFSFAGDVTITSYMPKKGEAVIVLSGDDGKPEIILHYNDKNSGVDNMDHLATISPAREKIISGPWLFSTICWMLLQLQHSSSGCHWTMNGSHITEEGVGTASSECLVKS